MFRAASKFSLRRSLHTQVPAAARHAQLNKLALAGAASAVAVTYFAWRTSSPANKIALDSPQRIATPTVKPELPTEPSHVDAGDVELQPESPIPSENTEDVPTVGETTGEGETKGEVEGEDEEGGGALGGGGSAAYNPETGEINWDCPCLGGMAHGPCGLQFREAFSCFVFSEDEPKGINCVTKFKAMQDCFREHPDVYGEEIMNDEEDDLELPPSDSESPLTEAPPSEFVTETPSSPPQESLKVQEGS